MPDELVHIHACVGITARDRESAFWTQAAQRKSHPHVMAIATSIQYRDDAR